MKKTSFGVSAIALAFVIFSCSSPVQGGVQASTANRAVVSENLTKLYATSFFVSDQERNLFWGSNSRNTFFNKSGDGGTNIEGQSLTRAANQKWLVMPIAPNSSDVIIVNQATAQPVDAMGPSGSEKGYNSFLNQKFFGTNGESAGQKYSMITNWDNSVSFVNTLIPGISPAYIERCSSNLNNGCFGSPYHTRNNVVLRKNVTNVSSNQQFNLTPADALPNAFTTYKKYSPTDVLLQPPRATDLSGTGMVSATEPVLIGESVLPFPLVHNDWTPVMQLAHSPYYKLQRSQYWKLVGQPTFVPAGTKITKTTQVSSGTKQTVMDSVVKTFGVKFTSNNKAEAKLEFVTLTMERNLELTFQMVTTHTTTFEATSEKTTTDTREYFAAKDTLKGLYQVVDRWTLVRGDGSTALTWDVANPDVTESSYTQP